jgi:predicted dehydrogenase
MTSQTTRRKFLEQTTHSGAVAAAATALGGVHAFGAENRAVVRLGIIGCGGIMTHHVRGLVSRREAVSIAWLCDVDPRQIERMAGYVTRDFQPPVPKRTGRFEDVVADNDVDAVIIATPHQWHAPIALAAIQSGKDAYIEKPISHVYNEGPLIVAAAKKNG